MSTSCAYQCRNSGFIPFSPGHRFFYAKGLDVDEALVFTCYHSRKGRARFTPHTAFVNPTTNPDAPERESVEIRAYAFWEHDPPQEPAMEM